MKAGAPVAQAAAAKSAKSPARAAAKSKANAEPSADDFVASLDHPLKAGIEAVRKGILSADKSISDGVKWNSLSFRTAEWFATVNLRSRETAQLMLHLGAKTGNAADADAIPDPKGPLKWLGKDRAMATLGGGTRAEGQPASVQGDREGVAALRVTAAPLTPGPFAMLQGRYEFCRSAHRMGCRTGRMLDARLSTFPTPASQFTHG